MSKEFYTIIKYIDILSSLVPILVLLFTSNGARLKLRRVLFFLAITWGVTALVSLALAEFSINTIWLFHVYDTFSTIGYLLFFHLTIPKVITRKVLGFGAIAYVLFTWLMIVVNSSVFKPVTLNLILTFSIPLLLSVYSFYNTAKESKVVNLLQDPVYWINCAILIHFGIGLCANLALEFIVENRSFNLTPIIWPFVLFSNIIHNIVFSIGVWKTNRT